MNTQPFRSVISKLWSYLGLAPMDIGDEAQVALAADEFELLLRDGRDGYVMTVEALVGEVGGRGDVRYVMLASLMKTGFALASESNIIVLLEDSSQRGARRLLVRGFHRYGEREPALLADLILEVMAAAETLAGLLSAYEGSASSVSATREPVAVEGTEFVVFRP